MRIHLIFRLCIKIKFALESSVPVSGFDEQPPRIEIKPDRRLASKDYIYKPDKLRLI